MTIENLNAVDNKPWFKQWFDSSFYHQLYAHRDEKEAAQFIDNLVMQLEPSAGARMLDLGCGGGRHSKYLASKGYELTGIDLAASSIRQAKKWESPKLRFFQSDMRDSLGQHYFDYVFNFFTSFGYFNDPCDDHKVIRNISCCLKPGGVFVMDYINSCFSEKQIIPFEEKEIDGIRYEISRWTSETHFFKKITIEEQLFGSPLEYTEQVKKFSVADIQQLFAGKGLEIECVFGDYQLNPYNAATSPRMIIIAKKTIL